MDDYILKKTVSTFSKWPPERLCIQYYNMVSFPVWLQIQYSRILLFVDRLQIFFEQLNFRLFITSKNKYLSNDMKIFGTCSIPLNKTLRSGHLQKWSPLKSGHKSSVKGVSLIEEFHCSGIDILFKTILQVLKKTWTILHSITTVNISLQDNSKG